MGKKKKKHNFQPGDNLKVLGGKSSNVLYNHHGTYVSDDEVYHFAKDKKGKKKCVYEKTTLDKFENGGHAGVFERTSDPAAANARARRRYEQEQQGAGEDYNLLKNSCDTEASRNTTGKGKNNQVNTWKKSFLTGAGIALAGIAIDALRSKE